MTKNYTELDNHAITKIKASDMSKKYKLVHFSKGLKMAAWYKKLGWNVVFVGTYDFLMAKKVG